ncbi:MAG: GatB/YqeY domain-containing protein [Bacteroidota bacterium]
MSLQEQINADVIVAMKAKDEISLRTLRALKSALLLVATEKGASEDGKVNDEVAIKTFQKLAKQRKESLDIYIQNNRQELAEKEKEELEVIERYLPKQMGIDEIKAVLSKIIAEVGATSLAEVGKVMPVAMKTLAGKTDGKTIQNVLKELFNN